MPSPTANRFVGALSDALRVIESAGVKRTFAAGQVIFSKGDEGDGLYIVDSGEVRISAVVGQNQERTLAMMGPGDYFGEMAVLDNAPRSATATAETATTATFLARNDFLPLLQQHPEIALNIAREFTARMRKLDQKYSEEVLQAERLSAIGRFAGTIVHDFKNPLTIIGLAAEMACSDETTPPMRHKAQTKIARQVERMTNMLQELIEFTRPTGQRPRLRPVEFARYMNPLADEIRQEIAERGVKLVMENSAPPVQVLLEPQRLARLFYNLLNNAVDEMPEGGKIFLRFIPTEKELQVEVEDTGKGIAPEIAERLFKPFATHGKEHGTGLGLTICKKIVEDHGGRIWAKASQAGKGATFAFTLPLATETPDSGPVAARAP